jgi:hypothetical protein
MQFRHELRSILAQSGNPYISSPASIPAGDVRRYLATANAPRSRSARFLADESLTSKSASGHETSNHALVAAYTDNTTREGLVAASDENLLIPLDGRPTTASGNVRSMLVTLVRHTVPPRAGPSPREASVDRYASPERCGPEGSKETGGTFCPNRNTDRFVDVRPPSRGCIAIFRDKLHRDLDAALPQALLDGDPSFTASAAPLSGADVPPPTALPDNVMIPCAGRYPEAVHGPAGIADVVREVRSIRPPPPTSFVRDLQRQAQSHDSSRRPPGEVEKVHLRPRSVDVLLGGRPRPPADVVVINRPPTETTVMSRRRVAESRRLLQSQQNVGVFSANSRRDSSAVASANGEGKLFPAFRSGVVRRTSSSLLY